MHRVYPQTKKTYYIHIYINIGTCDRYLYGIHVCTCIYTSSEHCVEGTVLQYVLYILYRLHCLCDFNSRARHCLGAYIIIIIIIILYRNRTASERRVFLLENCISSECNIYTYVYSYIYNIYYYYLHRSNYRAHIILTAHIIFTHARPAAVFAYII